MIVGCIAGAVGRERQLSGRVARVPRVCLPVPRLTHASSPPQKLSTALVAMGFDYALARERGRIACGEVGDTPLRYRGRSTGKLARLSPQAGAVQLGAVVTKNPGALRHAK
jgi:hypothetical protein